MMGPLPSDSGVILLAAARADLRDDLREDLLSAPARPFRRLNDRRRRYVAVPVHAPEKQVVPARPRNRLGADPPTITLSDLNPISDASIYDKKYPKSFLGSLGSFANVARQTLSLFRERCRGA